MFNEAFWFFYLVSIADALANSGIVAAVISGVAIAFGIAGVVACGIDGDDKAALEFKRVLRISTPVCAIGFLFAIATPPKEAFYAGAGQYVVQAAEVDQTLLQLKELIDKKIAEEAAKEAPKQ